MILSVTTIKAKHIVGGEVTYRVLETDGVLGGRAKYEIKFTIYRDALSGGAEFDPVGYFGVYRLINNDWQYYNVLEAGVENIETIHNVDNPCFESPPNIRYEKGEYILILELPIIDVPYQITYQRCCRTNDLVNIVSPDATGATYYVDIYPQAQIEGNQSPQFVDYPPTVLCADIEFEFDHSAIDKDGDSLSYEYFTPKHGGGLAGSTPGTNDQANDCNGVSPIPDENCEPPFPDVIFKSPYTFDNPIGGNPAIDLDENTGIMFGNPTDIGHYLVGVRINEYRDGQLIGSVQRDFQFVVTPCSPTVNAFVEGANLVDVDRLELRYCGKDTVTFINKSVKKNKILTTDWEFEIDGQKLVSNEWDATVFFKDTGQYIGKLVLNRGLDCADSMNLDIKIFSEVHAEYIFEFDSCNFKPIVFTNHSYSEAGSVLEYDWDFGDGQKSMEANPNVSYGTAGTYNQSLVVKDKNECVDTALSTIDYYPIVEDIDFKPSKHLACAPAKISFKIDSIFFDSLYEIVWDFGDGNSGNLVNPTYTYQEPGIYDVSVQIISPIGCTVERFREHNVEVRDGPTADFDFQNKHANILNPNIVFINNSEGAISYLWEFGDGGVSTEFEPSYMYQDTGTYTISLVAKAENFCTDTIRKDIFVSPEVPIFFPNAFTPNGDGKNDEFFGVCKFPNLLHDFELTVWNRWGGLVFETNDPLGRWNGAAMNSGQILPQGVYVYKYKYVSLLGRRFSGKGFVTIVK